MMIFHAHCDRCGKQEEVQPHGSTVTTGAPTDYRVQAPEGWVELRRVPMGGGERQVYVLCFDCVNALEDFFTGDGKVAGLLEAEHPLMRAVQEGQVGVYGLTPQENIEAMQKYVTGQYKQHQTPSWAVQGDDAVTELQPVCAVTGVHTSRIGEGGVCQHCGANYYDLSSASGLPDVTGPLAGLEETAGMPVVLPVGTKTVQCPYTNDSGRCGGTYERGQLHRHMKESHGVTVAVDSTACADCGEIMPVTKLPGHRCGTVVPEKEEQADKE